MLRDGNGGEYISGDFDRYLGDSVSLVNTREHSIHDTPRQPGVAERMNRTLDEGVSVSRSWWKDTALHFRSGRIRHLLHILPAPWIPSAPLDFR